MGPTIAATVFGAIGVIAAFVMRPQFVDRALAFRAALFWLLTTPVMFLLPTQIAILITCAMLALVFTPKGMDNRAAYYLAALLAVPGSIEAPLPFPGLNYLFVLDAPKLAFFTILAPAFIFSPRPNAAKYAPLAGALFIIMTFAFSILDFRVTNLTSGLRAAFTTFLLFALPFKALIRLIRTRSDVERIFGILIFLALIFFFAALISQGTKWNFYSYATNRFGYSKFADFRYGFLRVSVTVNTVLAGYIMTLGLLSTEYYRARRDFGFIRAWLMRGMCITAAFFTFSRGAWLGMIVGFGTYFLFARMPRAMRAPIVGFGLLVGLPLAFNLAANGDLNSVDDFGSFEYRQELLRTSIAYIQMHPLFGDPNFRESGFFDHLIQGQGIIDVVNSYINIALRYGLIGLTLFIGAYGSSIVALLKIGDLLPKTRRSDLELQRAVLLGANAGYLAVIFTTSSVSLITHVGTVLIALSVAFVAAARAEHRASLTESAGQAGENGDRGRSARNRLAADAAGDLYG
ncbi:MAG: O-antigen ligase family protein [Pseudomonadota bacterium]|nr:O-antigen ligase family protein [Pseudomonadota bacterium]